MIHHPRQHPRPRRSAPLALIASVLAAMTACSDSTPGAEGGAGGASGTPATCPATAPEGFVCIEAGEFYMGSPSGETGRRDDEARHLVRITEPFLLSVHEVTQAEWAALMPYNPAWFSEGGAGCTIEPCESRPVEMVNWFDAVSYLNIRSASEGLSACYQTIDCSGTPGEGCDEGESDCLHGHRCTTVTPVAGCTGYRLPTEAEWEMAARGGDEEDRYGPVDEIAYYIGTSRQRTRPVGGKLANALGLFDMYGNVAEWVYDRYDADYVYFGRANEAVEDPTGSEFTDTRSFRGGAWSMGLETCRAAFRGNQFATYHGHYLGLRAARNVTP